MHDGHDLSVRFCGVFFLLHLFDLNMLLRVLFFFFFFLHSQPSQLIPSSPQVKKLKLFVRYVYLPNTPRKTCWVQNTFFTKKIINFSIFFAPLMNQKESNLHKLLSIDKIGLVGHLSYSKGRIWNSHLDRYFPSKRGRSSFICRSKCLYSIHSILIDC